MAEQYIARFRTSTPEQRRAMIIKMGNASDPRAILLLRQIASGEPDPLLQKLALQAAQHLQSIAPLIPAAPVVRTAPPSPTPDRASDADFSSDAGIDDPPMSAAASTIEPAVIAPAASDGSKPDLAPVRVITPAQKALAKARIDQAISQQIDGQSEQALISLTEAASYDPSIISTTVGANLAVQLTDLPRAQAIAAILERSAAPEVRKGRSAVSLEFTPGEMFDTILEAVVLLMLFVIVFALVSVGVVSLINRVSSGFGNAITQYGTSDPPAFATLIANLTQNRTDSTANIQATLQAQNPALAGLSNRFANNPTLIALEGRVQRGEISATGSQFQSTATAALKSVFQQAPVTPPMPQVVALGAISGALRLLFTSVLTFMTIYLIGLMFGGSGGILRFVRYMIRSYLATYGLILVGLLILFYVLKQPNQASETQIPLIVFGLAFIALSAFIGFFLQAFAVARAHQFSVGKGIGSVLIGGLAFGVISTLVGLGAALTTAH